MDSLLNLLFLEFIIFPIAASQENPPLVTLKRSATNTGFAWLPSRKQKSQQTNLLWLIIINIIIKSD